MMKLGEYLYQLVFFIAFLVSLLLLRTKNTALKIFPLLLLIGNALELVVAFLKLKKYEGYPLLYHFYIPVEYLLLAFYYYMVIQTKLVRRLILISVPVFLMLCIIVSLGATKERPYPSLQFNVEGVLLIAWSITNLFFLKADWRIRITRNPYFWISVGILIFYTGNFFLMGSYNELKATDRELADKLFAYINSTLNISLYIFFIIGFRCSLKPVTT